jgi:hypothetical protein
MQLNEPAFRPFPTTAISPKGWLAQQLRIQADGISGNLDQFWPDIADSAWTGGTAEGWERMPYWLDGVIPLAWLLNDAPLKERLTGYMDHIIEHQHEDGWLGPHLLVRSSRFGLELGQPDCAHWPEVYKKIRDAGKLIQLFGDFDVLDAVCTQLGSAEGIYLWGAKGGDKKSTRTKLETYGID